MFLKGKDLAEKKLSYFDKKELFLKGDPFRYSKSCPIKCFSLKTS